jgi:hypothetical protein
LKDPDPKVKEWEESVTKNLRCGAEPIILWARKTLRKIMIMVFLVD